MKITKKLKSKSPLKHKSKKPKSQLRAVMAVKNLMCKKRTKLRNSVGADECPICMESGSVIKCCENNHKFHSECIEEWALKAVNTNCPSCRGAIILPPVNWSGKDLRGKDLSKMSLTGANLSGANLTDVGLTGANLTGAKLQGAKLQYANLYKFSEPLLF